MPMYKMQNVYHELRADLTNLHQGKTPVLCSVLEKSRRSPGFRLTVSFSVKMKKRDVCIYIPLIKKYHTKDLLGFILLLVGS